MSDCLPDSFFLHPIQNLRREFRPDDRKRVERYLLEREDFRAEDERVHPVSARGGDDPLLLLFRGVPFLEVEVVHHLVPYVRALEAVPRPESGDEADFLAGGGLGRGADPPNHLVLDLHLDFGREGLAAHGEDDGVRLLAAGSVASEGEVRIHDGKTAHVLLEVWNEPSFPRREEDGIVRPPDDAVHFPTPLQRLDDELPS